MYIGRFIETEGRVVVPRGWGGEGNGELLLNGYRVSVGNNEPVLGMDGSVVAQQCECAWCH